MNKDKTLKVIFVVCLAVLALTIAVIQPAQAAPDEGMKMTLIEYIANNNRLPHGDDPEILDDVWGTSYGFTPYIPYIISALLVKVLYLFTHDEYAVYVVSRMPSVISYVLAIVFLIKASDNLFERKYAKWLFVLLVTLYPSLLFTAGYINIDMFSIFTQSLIVYAWSCGIKDKWSTKSCVKLGVGVGLCAISYYNAYGYILASILLFIITITKTKITPKEFFKKFALVSCIALLIGGWFFVRNAVIYDGDFLALNISDECSEKYAMDKFKPSQKYLPAKEHLGVYEFFIVTRWFHVTAITFVASFGQLSNLRALPYTYVFYYALFAIAVIAYFARFYKFKQIKEWKQDKNKLFFDLNMILCMIVPVLLAIYYSYFCDYQPQGRYLLPMVIPMMYFVTIGCDTIINKIKNERIQKTTIVILNVLLISAVACFMIPFINAF